MNMLQKSYKDPIFPPSALNEENIMAYFCNHENPFYERSCDNEQLRMQTIAMTNVMSLSDMLLKMTGTQYVLMRASPPLFVICKHKRNAPNQGFNCLILYSFYLVTPLCYYYVLDGTIYQCPDVYSLVQSRLTNALDPLIKALNSTLDCLRFNASSGYSWEFKNTPAKVNDDNLSDDDVSKDFANLPSSTRDDANPLNVRSNPYQTQRTEILLRNLISQFPPQSDIVFEKQQNTTNRTNPNSQQNLNNSKNIEQYSTNMFGFGGPQSLANAPTPPATSLSTSNTLITDYAQQNAITPNSLSTIPMQSFDPNINANSMANPGSIPVMHNQESHMLMPTNGPASTPAVNVGALHGVSGIPDSQLGRPNSAFSQSMNQQTNMK